MTTDEFRARLRSGVFFGAPDHESISACDSAAWQPHFLWPGEIGSVPKTKPRPGQCVEPARSDGTVDSSIARRPFRSSSRPDLPSLAATSGPGQGAKAD